MPTADDEQEDEDLSQYTKSWRQNNSGNAKSSENFNPNNERSSHRVIFFIQQNQNEFFLNMPISIHSFIKQKQ